jgi:short-subunit dehydrogenase
VALRIDGCRVLLTGASGGLGGAIARALHERGAWLVLTARRAGPLDALAAELGEAEPAPADLSRPDDLAALAKRAADADVFVANAGLPASGRLEDFTPEELDRALDVNLRAPIQLTRALVPGMVERGRGHLVFVSSLSGKAASPGATVYSATKFGLRGFAQGLGQDLHGTGVGVTAIFPSFVRDAGLFADTGVELPRWVRTVTPEQVAEAVVRGIERGRAEIDVAPLDLRAGTLVAQAAPGLAAALQRRLGGAEIAERIARGQAGKR